VPKRHQPSRLVHIAALAALAGGVLVPAAAVGGAAGSTCSALARLLTGCRTAPVARATTSTMQCAGLALVKANGLPWVCTFDDEFDGTSVNRTLWTVQRTAAGGFGSGAACIEDDPRNVSVSGGYLNLTVRRVPYFRCKTPKSSFGTNWIGGSVYTASFGQAYGRFAIRAKFPEAHGRQGLQSALWTYPRSMSLNKATTGTHEIDIAEAYSRWPNYVMPTVHNFLGGTTEHCDVRDYGAAFHRYVVEWTPTNATFYYDGVKCMSAGRTGTSIPFLVALTQGLGNKADAPNASTPSPATMRIDWVRVWQ
jgi:beta-glucanase (GH16 family)